MPRFTRSKVKANGGGNDAGGVPSASVAVAAAADVTERASVQAILRLRPLQGSEISAGPPCIEMEGGGAVSFKLPKSSKRERFVFDTVFGAQTTQAEVFQRAGLPLVRDVLCGRNALLFTYGMTNSGKTHTMQGTEQEGGILTRSLDTIFNSIAPYRAKWCTFASDDQGRVRVLAAADARANRRACREAGIDAEEMDVDTTTDGAGAGGTSGAAMAAAAARRRRASYDTTVSPVGDKDRRYAVFMSYVEVYNELVYDLLDDTPLRDTEGWDPSNRPLKPTKKLLEAGGRTVVTGVTEIEVHSTEEAMEHIAAGQRARQVAATALNAASSRSHSVLNVRIVSAPLDAEGKDVLRDPSYPPHTAQLSLVDLAGSERTRRANSRGERQREAGGINKSLMTLRRCIETLRSRQAKGKRTGVVPYRDSTLTKLFRNYFAGDGRVVMVACASPGQPDAEETGPVLKFAARSREVSTVVSEPTTRTVGLPAGRGTAHKMIRRARRQMGIVEEEGEEAGSGGKGMSGTGVVASGNGGGGGTMDTSLDRGDPGATSSSEDESEPDIAMAFARRHGDARGGAGTAALVAGDEARHGALTKRRAALRTQEMAFRALLQEREAHLAAQDERVAYLEGALAEEREQRAELRQRAAVEAGAAAKQLAAVQRELQALRDEAAAVRAARDERKEEVEEYERECAAKEDALLRLKASLAEQTAELETCRAERAELKELRKRLAHEMREKENLAAAEMNRKEQEWRKRMGMSEAAREEMEGAAAAATRSKDEYQRRLKMVAQLLSEGRISQSDLDELTAGAGPTFAGNGSGRPRKRSSQERMAEDAAAAAAAVQDFIAGASVAGAAGSSGSGSVAALSTNNPDVYDEASVLREVEKKRVRRMKSAPVLNHKPDEHVDLDKEDMIMSPKVVGKKVRNVANVKLRNLLRRGKLQHEKYVVHHQEHDGEHEVFKGEVAKSVTNKGVTVRFTGMEKLTAESTLTPLRKGRKDRRR